MHVKDKVYMNREMLEKEGPITIVAFGDSVTHGAINGYMNYETVYWNLLKQRINKLRDYVPVNVINAGIGADYAKNSLNRLENQVLRYMPDLVIVCFGLNDINFPLEDYLSSLEEIFTKCRENGADVIFMTPNMFNTYVAEDTPCEYVNYAHKTAEYQNGGKMDLYMDSAVKLAKSQGIEVCDCYSRWKELSKTQDTTKLLANRINHPVPEMHKLFSDMLYDIIFKENINEQCTAAESAMYEA